jgi:hypothetical protein
MSGEADFGRGVFGFVHRSARATPRVRLKTLRDPQKDGCKGNEAKKSALKFVVASRDASKLFERREEVLDAVTFAIMT